MQKETANYIKGASSVMSLVLHQPTQLNSTMLAAVTFGVESGGWDLALIDRRK